MELHRSSIELFRYHGKSFSSIHLTVGSVECGHANTHTHTYIHTATKIEEYLTLLFALQLIICVSMTFYKLKYRRFPIDIEEGVLEEILNE